MNSPIGEKLQQAMGLIRSGQTAAGEQLCHQVLKANPGQADALHLLAMSAERRGDMGVAENLFRQSLTAEPRQPAVLSNLANMLTQLDRHDEAIGWYRQAVLLDQNFLNAWMGLARALSYAGQHQDAVEAADKATGLAPQTPAVWELLGFAWRGAGNGVAAHDAYKKGLEIDPKNARIWYNYGTLLREISEFKEATAAFERAQECGLETPDLYRNLAEAYYESHESEKALAAFDEAIDRFPSDPQSHYLRAKFRWEVGQPGDHLSELRQAISAQPQDPDLWGSYFDLLSNQGRFEEILEGIDEAPAETVTAPRLRLARAVAYTGLKRFDEGTAVFEELLAQDRVGLPPRRLFAEHLLMAGQPERADIICTEVIDQERYDIIAWSLRGTAWQLMGDPRADWVFDFERMVRPIEVPLPDGYTDRAEYFDMVRQELEEMHGMQAHPLDQTLRGGTQTNGFLFKQRNPIIQQLGRQIITAIESELPKFPDDPDNPFWGRNTGAVEFSGAWSVRLRSQGYHTNHYHPEGWISSALYIALPDVVHESTSNEGHIQFGVPVDEMGLSLKAARIIEPKVGTLAMFPSYMWHGTIPFTSDQPRITVAYDLVPSTP